MTDEELHPDLRRARFGKGPEDRFLAFWLRLLTERRLGSSQRRTTKTVEEFLQDKCVRAATQSVGWPALCAELTDASRRYFLTCAQDPRYRASFFGLKTLSDDETRTKAAGDAADMLAVLACAATETSSASQVQDLAKALVDGALAAMPGIGPELRRKAQQHVGAPELLVHLLPEHD